MFVTSSVPPLVRLPNTRIKSLVSGLLTSIVVVPPAAKVSVLLKVSVPEGGAG